ncbi:hypothetical protein FRC03_002114 [Tulasnella sp. 419]|nr:hypothetical protein FRC03_002114 [Tulasnella sp. 419]
MQFGGINDQLIIGLRIYRELNIWDRNTSALVHSIALTQLRSVWDMSFRWNSSDPRDIMLVFASCSTLQIWSTSGSGTKENEGVGSEGGSEEVCLTEVQESTASIDEGQHNQAESKHPAPAQYRSIQSFQHPSHHTSPPYQHLDSSQTLQLSLSRSEQRSISHQIVSKSRIISLPVYDPLFPRHILRISDEHPRQEHINAQIYHQSHPFHISDPYQYRNLPIILPRNQKPPGLTYHGIPPHFLPYPFVDYLDMYDGFQGLKAPFF